MAQNFGDPFQYIQTGLRDVREGFQQGFENRNVTEDRRLAAEQRLRMMEANKKMAESIRAKPAMWRDPEAAAAALEGGYDPQIAFKLAKQEFHDSPVEVATGAILRDQINLGKQIFSMSGDDPNKEVLQTKFNANLAMMGRLQRTRDTSGEIFDPVFSNMQPSAFEAFDRLVINQFQDKYGEIPKDSFLKAGKSILGKSDLMKSILKEGQVQTDRVGYNQLFRYVTGGLGFDQYKDMLDKDEVTVKVFAGQDSTSPKGMVSKTFKLSDFPALNDLVRSNVYTNEAITLAAEKKLIPEEFLREWQLLNAQKKTGKEAPVSIEDVIGSKISNAVSGRLNEARSLTQDVLSGGEGEESLFTSEATQRLRKSQSKKKRAIGVAVDMMSEAPLAGATAVVKPVTRYLKSQYKRRMKESQEE